MNKIDNSLSFKARLDYSEFSNCDKKRMARVAKIFKEQTSQYPNYTFHLFDFGADFHLIFDYSSKSIKRYDVFEGLIYPRTFKKLRALSDAELAQKLKKIFEVQIVTDKLDKDADKLYKKYYDKVPKSLYDKFGDMLIDLKNAHAKKLFSDDDILGRPNAIDISI